MAAFKPKLASLVGEDHLPELLALVTEVAASVPEMAGRYQGAELAQMVRAFS